MSINHNPKKYIQQWYEKIWIHILILAILILATYGNALNNAFVSDDIAEIRDNPNIGNFSNVTYYKFTPIRVFLYFITFHITGPNPISFRLISYFFHFGSVILIYIILWKIFQKKLIALFASSIFAIHPALSEAVIWISGGTYPQYTFFFLLSFFLYLLSDNSRKYYIFSIFAYLFAFASHPVMPIALFLIYPLYEFSFGNFKKWIKVIPYFLIAVIYLFINLSVLPERETTLQSTHYQEKGIDNPFIQIPIAITSYFELTFWPQVLTLYHSELAFLPLNFTARLLLTISFFAFFVMALLKSRKIFFFLSIFLLALTPTLTPFRFNWIVAERYLYLPSVGIFTLISWGIYKLSKKFNVILGLFVIILILLITRTIIRNIEWHSEDNLWIATGKTSPSSPNTHNNLGDVYGRWGDKERALQEFQTAIVLKPNYADAFHNLANTYREISALDKALENYQKAISFNPNLWQSYQNIAAIYFMQGQYAKALENIQKAIQINPKNVNLYLNLGIVYLSLGEKEKAKEAFSLILSADPQNQLARAGLTEASK